MMMPNVLLLGRKKWAASVLAYLMESGYTVIGVVGMKELTGEQGTPVIQKAEAFGIPVYAPEDMYDRIDGNARTFDGKIIDILISYLFYARVEAPLIEIAGKAVNFHPAILPDYQGLGGYNAAILDDKDEYGVSAHLMTEDFDAGDIIKISRFKIDPDETALTLERKSMKAMFELFKEIFSDQFEMYVNDAYKNDISAGRYISRTEFEDMKFIPSDATEEEIDRRIRAFWYPPFEGAKVRVGSEYYTLVNETVLSLIEKYTCSEEAVYE